MSATSTPPEPENAAEAISEQRKTLSEVFDDIFWKTTFRTTSLWVDKEGRDLCNACDELAVEGAGLCQRCLWEMEN